MARRETDLDEAAFREVKTISVIISSHGGKEWEDLAMARAYPSVADQGFHQVIVNHEVGHTLAEVRNFNASRANGDYLCFLDADDELAPGFLEAMNVALEATKKPSLFTPAVIYARNSVRPKPKLWPRMDFKVGNWCVIGTLIPRRMFNQIGGFREYKLYEDYALWAMAEAKFGVEVIEVPDAVYVAHYARKSRNRSLGQCQRFFWHQQIGYDVWPESFEKPTAEEVASECLSGSYLRFTP